MTQISVILPFKNAGETVDRALRSLLLRRDLDLELLAIDDASTDSGPERVRRWAALDPRVRLIAGHGRGIAAALNRGLGLSRGRLIARMDADDACDPDRLTRQAAHLDDQPQLAVVGCQVRAVADEGVVSEGLQRYVAWQNSLLTPTQHHHQLFVESPLCHPSVMVRREAMEAAGGYKDDAGPEDYDLWLRLDALGYRFAKLPQVLFDWHHRSGRATFADPRYSLARMRTAKAPFLAARLKDHARERLVTWGAGATGRRLMRELEPHGLRADLFVDIDPRKLGRTARSAPIVGRSALNPKTDVVVAAVGSRGARDLIRAQLESLGFVEGDNAFCAA